jgi:hypothetical protein
MIHSCVACEVNAEKHFALIDSELAELNKNQNTSMMEANGERDLLLLSLTLSPAPLHLNPAPLQGMKSVKAKPR